MSADAIKAELDQFRTDFLRLRQEIAKVIVGQDDIVEGTLTALIAGGHVLLEGVPGLGKTLLVRTIADALHLKFARIQFTPDLMPADLVGTNVVMETPDHGRKFEFQKGPVFANIVLADEINRATPKTQSRPARSDAGTPRDGRRANVSRCRNRSSCLATQNPLEMEGTYPLPEAQLDRFFFKLLVKFPTFGDLETILDRTTEASNPQASRDVRRRADHGAVETRSSDSDCDGGPAIRNRGRDGHAPGARTGGADDQAIRPLRQQPARRTGDHPRRQAPGHPRQPLPRCPRRHPRGRADGPAAPAHPELRRPGRQRAAGRGRRQRPEVRRRNLL